MKMVNVGACRLLARLSLMILALPAVAVCSLDGSWYLNVELTERENPNVQFGKWETSYILERYKKFYGPVEIDLPSVKILHAGGSHDYLTKPGPTKAETRQIYQGLDIENTDLIGCHEGGIFWEKMLFARLQMDCDVAAWDALTNCKTPKNVRLVYSEAD